MQNKIEAVKAKVAECIAAAERTFNIKMPNVQVRFDLTGRAAGMAGYRGNSFYLRFNRNHMQLGGQTWEHLLNDTVPHEVAHTVCQSHPQFGRNHDNGWKRVCVALGGNGRRCYSEDDAPEAIAAMRPYVYITTNGSEVRVTKVMHSKIQTRGASYSFKHGKGSINKSCQFSYMTAPAVAAAKKPVVVTAPPAVEPTLKLSGNKVSIPLKQPQGKAMSKADLIRLQIAQGKSEAECVEYGVSVLGMSRALAKTYVKNNWHCK